MSAHSFGDDEPNAAEQFIALGFSLKAYRSEIDGTVVVKIETQSGVFFPDPVPHNGLGPKLIVFIDGVFDPVYHNPLEPGDPHYCDEFPDLREPV